MVKFISAVIIMLNLPFFAVGAESSAKTYCMVSRLSDKPVRDQLLHATITENDMATIEFQPRAYQSYDRDFNAFAMVTGKKVKINGTTPDGIFTLSVDDLTVKTVFESTTSSGKLVIQCTPSLN